MKKYTQLLGASLALIFLLALIGVQIWLLIAYLLPGIIIISVGYFVNIVIYWFIYNNKRSDSMIKYGWLPTIIIPWVTFYLYFMFSFVKTKYLIKMIKASKIEKEENLGLQNIDYKLNNHNDKILINNKNYNNAPIQEFNELILLNSGTEKTKTLFKDLNDAKNQILIEYFIFNDGIIFRKFKKILLEKAKQGLEIKIIIDYLGCLQTSNKAFEDFIKEKNIEFIISNKAYLPFTTGDSYYRSHQKFIIIDQKITYFGGINIGDDYNHLYPKYGFWDDITFKVNDSLVESCLIRFKTDWFIAKGKELDLNTVFKDEKKSSLNNVSEQDQKNVIQTLWDGPQYSRKVFAENLIYQIDNSKKQIILITPYIILPFDIRESLLKAKSRGVDIKIITTGKADKKTAYYVGNFFVQNLSQEGIKVYRTNNSFMHAKLYIFDDETVITGTSNLDYRSIYYHYETNYLVNSKEFNKKSREYFELLLKNSYIEEEDSNMWGGTKIILWQLVKLIAPTM